MRISDRSSDVCSSDLVRTIGADDYVDGSLMKVDGKVYDLPYTLGNFSILWYRDDLLEAAGVGVPGNWEDLRAAAETLTDEDTKGFIFPAGKNRMTSIFFSSLIDRKSVGWGKRVSVRVDLGGRSIVKKKQ